MISDAQNTYTGMSVVTKNTNKKHCALGCRFFIKKIKESKVPERTLDNL